MLTVYVLEKYETRCLFPGAMLHFLLSTITITYSTLPSPGGGKMRDTGNEIVTYFGKRDLNLVLLLTL